MLEPARNWLWAQLKAVKPAFFSKKPHFNFISAHYFWIVSATFVAAIAIYASGKGSISFIDALMFGSGANTQAGLNPVDVNKLNGFQQGMIYFFAMLSNPITLHACVVVLRLYWFEKRFQRWVKDARQRRPTLSKSKSRSRPDDAEQDAQGVNGRDILVMPRNDQTRRVANDGILLDGLQNPSPNVSPTSRDNKNSEASTVTPEHPVDDARLASLAGAAAHQDASDDSPSQPGQDVDGNAGAGGANPGHTSISFADTAINSDGKVVDASDFLQRRSHAEHIAILERQRNQDNEVLRIPGPRDAERGLGPRRLQADDLQDDDDNAITRSRTFDSHNEPAASHSANFRDRHPTITIAEPQRRRKMGPSPDTADAPGPSASSMRFRQSRLFAFDRDKAGGSGNRPRTPRPVRTRTMETIRSVLSQNKDEEDMPYLSYTPTMGRNSNFVGLTLEQREELGGIEYRSLRTLALILLVYFWGFQLIILTFLLPFILHNVYYGNVVEAVGISKTWWGFFTSNVAFMDVGFTLTPNSMISFQRSEYVLMIMWFFIIIGNTGFPVMLRFLIWVLAKLMPTGSGLWEELRFLLDHPRRCFTLLFPSGPTWWLFWILVGLNALDLLFFIVLDLGAEPVSALPLRNRVVIGFFQAASTRTAGFSAVNMSDLHPAMPVLYMIMMYISVFPIAISIRRTNVYEEKSLGVYEKPEDDEVDGNSVSYVGTHLRRQLSFDLWFVFLGFFILAITEGSKIQARQFDMFDVLFEIISAYGTVGLSMGAPGGDTSLCARFSVVGKLVIVAMQIRGRHRGLPYGLDRAVLLPSESRFRKESDQAEAALARVGTGVLGAASTGLQRQATANTLRGASSPGPGPGPGEHRERANSNIISQILHPGPVVQREGGLLQRRASLVSRTQTEPMPDDDDDDYDSDQVGPLSDFLADEPLKPRRVRTSPAF